MNFAFISKYFKLLSLKKISIFTLIVLIITGSIYMFSINQSGNQDTMLLVHTINKLQKDIQGFQSNRVNANESNQDIKGKIDPSLIQEFRDDEEFLKAIVELKKEKMLASLAIEVEGLKRQRKKALEEDNPPPMPVEPEIVYIEKEPEIPSAPPEPPRPKINLAIANETNQTAVVTIDGGNPITLRIGNVVSDYRLINVTRNYIQVEDLVKNTIQSVYIK